MYAVSSHDDSGAAAAAAVAAAAAAHTEGQQELICTRQAATTSREAYKKCIPVLALCHARTGVPGAACHASPAAFAQNQSSH